MLAPIQGKGSSKSFNGILLKWTFIAISEYNTHAQCIQIYMNTHTCQLSMWNFMWNCFVFCCLIYLKKKLALVTSIFLYACESWTLTAELQRRIQAMEMRCYCKILHISYKDPVTNFNSCSEPVFYAAVEEDCASSLVTEVFDDSDEVGADVVLLHGCPQSFMHASSCMLVNHGPSQQSSEEEYKPQKWGATARYYASHAKTMLPTRKSMPRSSRLSDHTKTSWPSQWYGHVSRSSGLAKTILQGTVKGERRQGRQRKRWEDNIREWTGLEFAKSQRAVENREERRKLVAKSSVVPQQPWCLRDRWCWWWYMCLQPTHTSTPTKKQNEHNYVDGCTFMTATQRSNQ